MPIVLLCDLNMDTEHFAQHIANGLAWHEGDRRIHQERREKIKDLIHQMLKCDGANPTAVRNWTREVQLAFNQVGEHGIREIA